MTAILDVRPLPRERLYGDAQLGTQRNLASVVYSLRTTIDEMMERGLIAKKDSFGFAMAVPAVTYKSSWDNPERLIWFVVGWGPDGDRYIANAVRKIRAAAREGWNTQALRLNGSYRFQDEIESQDENGNFPWGDFPFDGAVYVDSLAGRLLGAVSAFPKEQDPIVASLILGFIGLEMYNIDSVS